MEGWSACGALGWRSWRCRLRCSGCVRGCWPPHCRGKVGYLHAAIRSLQDRVWEHSAPSTQLGTCGFSATEREVGQHSGEAVKPPGLGQAQLSLCGTSLLPCPAQGAEPFTPTQGRTLPCWDRAILQPRDGDGSHVPYLWVCSVFKTGWDCPAMRGTRGGSGGMGGIGLGRARAISG